MDRKAHYRYNPLQSMENSLLHESICQLQRDWDCQLFEKMESMLLEYAHQKMESRALDFQNLKDSELKTKAMGQTETQESGDSQVDICP